MSHMDMVDGARHFRAPLDFVVKGFPFAALAARVGFAYPPLTEMADTPPLKARVNHNRWIVDCPDCAGAEYAWLDQPFMMCASCFNGAVGGKWRLVAIPANWAQLEAVLKARPIPQNRNWNPGESVAKLKADNRKHGLPAEVS